ncbi:UNVERIFIED_CONTAM: hypothetical protein FKN15_070955 [Acipenser sinensis]
MPRSTEQCTRFQVRCLDFWAVIVFPKPEELDDFGQGFGRLAQNAAFNKAVGAIDGFHVRIKGPGGAYAQDYLNRKLLFSIQHQAICD